MLHPIICTAVINRNKLGFTIVTTYPSSEDYDHEKVFLQALQQLDLANLEDEKINIICDRYTVHLLVGELLYYACLTSVQRSPTEAMKMTLFAQKFLDRVRSVYRELPLLTDLSQDFNNVFTVDLSAPLVKLSMSYGYQEAKNLVSVQDELIEVRQILFESVQKLIDRGQKLDELVKKTQTLEITVHNDFLLRSRSTKKKKTKSFAIFVSILMILSSVALGIVFYVEIMK